MNEIKRQRLKHEVISRLKQHNNFHMAFDGIIDIYVDMIIQHDIFKDKLSHYSGDPRGKEILETVINRLEEDINRYAENLCLTSE